MDSLRIKKTPQVPPSLGFLMDLPALPRSVSPGDLTLPFYTQVYLEASLTASPWASPHSALHVAPADTLIRAFSELNQHTTDANASKPQPGHGAI